MPKPFSRQRVEANDAVGKQVVSFSSAAEKVRRCRTGANENETTFFIDAGSAPVICCTSEFPLIIFPAFMTKFSGTRNRVKAPDFFACVNLERAGIPGSGLPTFRAGNANDNKVFIDCRSRSRPVIDAIKICFHSFPQVERSTAPESGIGLPGFGIK